MLATKKCRNCDLPSLPNRARCEKHLTYFRKYAFSWRHKNKEHANESRRRWHDSNPDHLWAYSIRVKYGVTPEMYNAMLEAQGGKCAIEGCTAEIPGKIGSKESSRRWHIDHDHKTGKVRGLLCTTCNLGVGYFKDDVALLQSAIRYLEKAKQD